MRSGTRIYSRPREDEVARQQRGAAAQERDRFGHAEDQVARVARLPDLAVDARADAQAPGRAAGQRARRHDAGAEGRPAVEALAQAPLPCRPRTGRQLRPTTRSRAAGRERGRGEGGWTRRDRGDRPTAATLQLPRAVAHVIADGVPEDMPRRLSGRHVAGAPADDDDELALVVEARRLLRDARDGDGRGGAGQRGGGLVEEDGVLRQGHLGLVRGNGGGGQTCRRADATDRGKGTAPPGRVWHS